MDADHLNVARQVLSAEVETEHAKYLARREEVRAAVADIERVASATARNAYAVAIGSTLAVTTGLVCMRWALADHSDRGSHDAHRPRIRVLA